MRPPFAASPNGRLFRTSLAFLGLFFVESLAALFMIFAVPSDPDARAFLGISLYRWMIASSVIFIAASSAGLFIHLLRGGEKSRLVEIIQSPKAQKNTAVLSAAVIPLVNLGAMYAAEPGNTALSAGFSRLVPVIILVMVICAELFILSCIWIQERSWQQGPTVRLGLWLTAALILAAVLILSTGFSLTPTTFGWYEYGVPLAGQQVLILFDISLLILAGALLAHLNRTRSRPSQRVPAGLIDIVFVAAIWLAAVLLWQSYPVPLTWFTPDTYPPNFEVYPNSDAMLYDSAAQGILFGTQWANEEVHYKPLYVGLLTVFNGLAESRYPQVILYQTLLLAFFPVALYLLGKALLGRLFGLLVAAAAIAREMNQLSISELTTLSTSKLLLSELYTALGLTLLLLVLVTWLKGPTNRLPSAARLDAPMAFLAGGIVGLIIQVRLQTVLILPALVLIALFAYFRQWRTWLKVSAALIVGFAITTAPLILNNYRAAHTFALEKPGYFSRTFTYAQSDTKTTDQDSLDLNQPVALSGFRSIFNLAVGASTHFTHNTVSAALTLPVGKEWAASDLAALAWINEKPGLNRLSFPLLGFNLAMIATGTAFLWRQKRLAGLLPLLIFAVYNLSSSLVGFSGQRFILPVDWVGYFYYFAGLTWLASALFTAAGCNAFCQLPFWIHPEGYVERPPLTSIGSPKAGVPWQLSLPIGLVLALSLLLPLLQTATPVRYPRLDESQTRAEILRIASHKLSTEQFEQVAALLDQPDTVVASGVSLYPRAIATEKAARDVLRYAGKTTYPVLSFLQLGANRHWVLLPMEQMDPITLPHASETLVAGTWTLGRFDEVSIKAFIVITTDSEAVYLSNEVIQE